MLFYQKKKEKPLTMVTHSPPFVRQKQEALFQSYLLVVLFQKKFIQFLKKTYLCYSLLKFGLIYGITIVTSDCDIAI